MKDDPSSKQAEHEELILLLRTLRVEATAEAHFEERFLYDFRERVVREAVCRPARELAWERLLQLLSNIGPRRLFWGASSLGLGMVCLGSALWHQWGSSGAPVARVYRVPVDPQKLMPEATSAEDVVRTTVHRKARRAYTETLMASRTIDDSATLVVGEEDDGHRVFFSSPSIDMELMGREASTQDPWLHVVY